MKAVVFGMGVSGSSVAEFLIEKGFSVFVYDDNPAAIDGNILYGKLNRYDPDTVYDLAIVSPGFSPDHPAVASVREKGVEVIGDIEFAGRYLKNEKIIAVTGTNGKSTTVSIISSLLKEAGFSTFLCGNIGTPVFQAIGKNYEFLVIEISSFQLETLSSVNPDVSVILNVSPDHLDRYVTYEEYVMTKVKLAKLTRPDGILVLNGRDEALVAGCRAIPVEKKFFSLDFTGEIGYRDGVIYLGNDEIFVKETKLEGVHNVENIMASVLAVSEWVKDFEIIRKAVNNFTPLPHRMEFVDKIGDVVFINDSKGTNVAATEKSLSGYSDKEVVLILGGVDKGGSYEVLRELAETRCKGVVLIGEAKSRIKPCFEDFFPLVEAESMQEAVEISFKLSENRGVVLFSPACSSFDWYKNYIERGNDFKNKVFGLKKEMSE